MLYSILWKDVEKNNIGCVQSRKKAIKGKHGSLGTFHFISIKYAYARKDSSRVNNIKTLEKEQQKQTKDFKASRRKEISNIITEFYEIENKNIMKAVKRKVDSSKIIKLIKS